MSDNSESGSNIWLQLLFLLGILGLIAKYMAFEPFPKLFLIADIDYIVLWAMVFSGVILSFFVVAIVSAFVAAIGVLWLGVVGVVAAIKVFFNGR